MLIVIQEIDTALLDHRRADAHRGPVSVLIVAEEVYRNLGPSFNLLRTADGPGDIAIQIDFQSSSVGWGHLDGYVAWGVRAEELCRQPRGDGEVASRDAINDFRFYFAVF